MGCPLNCTWAQSSAQRGGPGQTHAAGWEERCSSSRIPLAGEGLVQLPILRICLWLFIMSLNLVLCAHGSVLAVLPFLFHCSLPALLWDVPRAVTLVLFILSVPRRVLRRLVSQHTTLPSSFWARSSSCLEAALLETSTVSVTSHILYNTLHCEVWSSLGRLGNTYVQE